MYVPFDLINPDARIWIFQANRFFAVDEEEKIKNSGLQFVEQWTAHKQNLLGSFEILKHLFIILSVDETVNGASGCSIDKSFSFIKQLESDYALSLLDRKAIAYEKSGEIHLSRLDEFEKLYKKGSIQDHIMIYNNLILTKKDLHDNWRIPMHDSWLMQVI